MEVEKSWGTEWTTPANNRGVIPQSFTVTALWDQSTVTTYYLTSCSQHPILTLHLISEEKPHLQVCVCRAKRGNLPCMTPSNTQGPLGPSRLEPEHRAYSWKRKIFSFSRTHRDAMSPGVLIYSQHPLYRWGRGINPACSSHKGSSPLSLCMSVQLPSQQTNVLCAQTLVQM